MNAPPSPTDPSNNPGESAQMQERAAESSWTILLILLAVGLLVTLPILFKSVSAEANRWRVAAAIERYLDGGDRKQAIEDLQTLSKKLPLDYRVKLRLARWLFEEKEAEQALDLLAKIPEAQHDDSFVNLKIECLIGSGRPKEALELYRAANPASVVRGYPQEARHKNRLAYMSALAATDLQLSFDNINYVIIREAQDFAQRLDFPLRPRRQLLFCAAVLYRDRAKRVELDQASRDKAASIALQITSDHIPVLRAEHQKLCQEPSSVEQSQFGEEEAGGSKEASAAKSKEARKAAAKKIADQREEAAFTLAAYCALRALIYQDLGQLSKSKSDRKTVSHLGYMPEEIAKRFPSFKKAAQHLRTMSSLLDTRGCVLFRRRQIVEARNDLTVAITAQQALVDVAEYLDRTSIEYGASLDPRQQAELYVQLPKRSLAVMLFHRSWVLNSVGMNSNWTGQRVDSYQLGRRQLLDAAGDIARIRELGFQPDSYLF